MNRTAAALSIAGLALAGCRASDAPAPAAASVATTATPAAAAAGAPATAADVAAVPQAPRFVLPGDITTQTTVADLRARFGAANVVAGEIPGAEGETSQGVILYPDDPARRAYVSLDGQRVTDVRVWDRPSQWAFDDGIGIGTPLSTLVERNGKPIRFYGLDWDYGGTISDWNGGTLDPRASSPPGPWRSIRLGAREDIGQRRYPMGDGEFDSTDKAFPNVGQDLVVGEIGVSFDVPGPGDGDEDAAGSDGG